MPTTNSSDTFALYARCSHKSMPDTGNRHRCTRSYGSLYFKLWSLETNEHFAVVNRTARWVGDDKHAV